MEIIGFIGRSTLQPDRLVGRSPDYEIIAVVKFRALVLTVAGLEHANRAKRLSLVYSRLASATGDLAYRLSALFWARYAYFSFPDDVSRDSHEGRDVTDRLAVVLSLHTPTSIATPLRRRRSGDFLA